MLSLVVVGCLFVVCCWLSKVVYRLLSGVVCCGCVLFVVYVVVVCGFALFVLLVVC